MTASVGAVMTASGTSSKRMSPGACRIVPNNVLTLSYRLSAIGYRLPAIGYRLSAIGYRLSAIGYRVSATRCFLLAIGKQLTAGKWAGGNQRCAPAKPNFGGHYLGGPNATPRPQPDPKNARQAPP